MANNSESINLEQFDNVETEDFISFNNNNNENEKRENSDEINILQVNKNENSNDIFHNEENKNELESNNENKKENNENNNEINEIKNIETEKLTTDESNLKIHSNILNFENHQKRSMEGAEDGRKRKIGEGDYDMFKRKKEMCYRCGGIGHYHSACSSPQGALESGKLCFRCGGKGHVQHHCPSTISLESCFKCGLVGHRARDCNSNVNLQMMGVGIVRGPRVPPAPRMDFMPMMNNMNRGGNVNSMPPNMPPNMSSNMSSNMPPNMSNMSPNMPVPNFGAGRGMSNFNPMNPNVNPHFAAAYIAALNAHPDGCFRCGKVGHFLRDCPNPPGFAELKICYKCGQEGHLMRDCNTCFFCHKPGHYAKTCPDRGNQQKNSENSESKHSDQQLGASNNSNNNHHNHNNNNYNNNHHHNHNHNNNHHNHNHNNHHYHVNAKIINAKLQAQAQVQAAQAHAHAQVQAAHAQAQAQAQAQAAQVQAQAQATQAYNYNFNANPYVPTVDDMSAAAMNDPTNANNYRYNYNRNDFRRGNEQVPPTHNYANNYYQNYADHTQTQSNYNGYPHY
eukprot:TRINITY_DN4732_c0_g1_i2.p1 TRINITY_DN4732_c0_g1~~TRINITY_DN4732_c0_g1_i2.p1  ORF type:complete len:564 (+),score=235.17 TRINITY_DN4732_c0_g1_i2:10-1701(+)